MTAEAIRDYIENVEAMKPTVEEYKQDVSSLKEIMGLTLYPEAYLEPPVDLPTGVNVDDVMLTQLVDMASGLSRDIAGVKTPLYRRQKVKNIWRKLPGYSVVHPLVREAWFLRKGQVEAHVKLNEPIMILPQDVKAAIVEAERTGDKAAVKALTAEYTDLLADRIQGGLDELFGQTEAMTATRHGFD